MDEANVESHGLSYHKRVLPGDRPEWRDAVVDRMRRMVVRDRGHACVVLWSLGNEAGYGDAFPAMSAAARALDPERRPIQYADMNLAADLDSQTYPSVAWLGQHLAGQAVRKGEQGQKSHVAQHGPYPSGKLFLMNEYAHARGNAVGNFQAYWDRIESDARLIGGYVWCWHDMPLRRTLPDGRRVDAIGGDFGDVPNDGDFCMCGLVDGARQPHPAYYEVRQVQRPVVVAADPARPGQLVVRNRQAFAGLEDFTVRWSLLADGREVTRGAWSDLVVPPGGAAARPWPVPADVLARTAGEKLLRCTLVLARATAWAPAGTELGFDEIPLGGTWQPAAAGAVEALAVVRTPEGGWRITPTTPPGRAPTAADPAAALGADEIRFDARGRLVHWTLAGTDALAGPVEPDFWRAPTSGDRGWKMETRLAAWREAMARAEVERGDGTAGPDGARLVVTWRLPTVGGRCTLAWTVRNRRELAARFTLSDCAPTAPIVPRLGVVWTLPGTLRAVEWYGRGPHESYADRQAAAGLGLWRAQVDDWVHRYHRPQENGNRTDVRWLALGTVDPAGPRLRFESLGTPLAASAWPWTQADLENTARPYDLPTRATVTLHLDHRQMGVGADNTWGAMPYPEYQLQPQGRHTYAFRVVRER